MEYKNYPLPLNFKVMCGAAGHKPFFMKTFFMKLIKSLAPR